MTDVKRTTSRADDVDDDLDVEGHYLVTDPMRYDATSVRSNEAESWARDQRHRRAASNHSRRLRLAERVSGRRARALAVAAPAITAVTLAALASGTLS